MKRVNQAHMCRKIFQVVGIASAKALRRYHAHCVYDQQEASAAEAEAGKRVVRDDSKEPKGSRTGEV